MCHSLSTAINVYTHVLCLKRVWYFGIQYLFFFSWKKKKKEVVFFGLVLPVIIKSGACLFVCATCVCVCAEKDQAKFLQAFFF